MVCGARREHRTSALAARARRSHAIVPSPNYALGAPDEARLADIVSWQREHQLVAARGRPRLHVLQGAARPEADRASCHRVRCATLVWA